MAVAVVAVAVGAGAAAGSTGGEPPTEDGGESSRRAELENLLRLSGEPFTDADVDARLEEESLHPQTVVDADLVTPSDELIINVQDDQ